MIKADLNKAKDKETNNFPRIFSSNVRFYRKNRVTWFYQAENLIFPQSNVILLGLLRYATAVF